MTVERPVEASVVVADWLAALTDAQREAARLCWLEGYTQREASCVLGIWHSAIWYRLSAARQKWGVDTEQQRRLRVCSNRE
jgi:DNA-directed RNA polymerase specialized sigma24 family protein